MYTNQLPSSLVVYIALDDLELTPGECNWLGSTPGPSSSTPAPDTALTCTFEESLCGWSQDNMDGEDWHYTTGELVGVDVGGTHTLGPTTDHTTQLSGGKALLFMFVNQRRIILHSHISQDYHIPIFLLLQDALINCTPEVIHINSSSLMQSVFADAYVDAKTTLLRCSQNSCDSTVFPSSSVSVQTFKYLAQLGYWSVYPSVILFLHVLQMRWTLIVPLTTYHSLLLDK